MLDEERCRRAVAEAFPDLEVRSVRYFAAGWDYELWETNDETLFRFPLRQECAEGLRVEARLLPALADELSVAVPQPEYFSDGCASFPLPFFGYRKLPGEPLAEAALGQPAKLSIAVQAGRFLRELHGFSIERAAQLGVPVYSPKAWRGWYEAFYEKVRSQVIPQLQPDDAAAAESFWRGLLDDEDFSRFEPVLIHRDFDDAHMLVAAGRLAGVIDFADACVGDPALDFAGCDGAFRERMLVAYGCPGEEAVRLSARADVYRQTSPFHAVLYGLAINDLDWVRQGIEAIREQI